MGKDRKPGSRRKVAAIFKAIGGRLGIGLDAPGLDEPTAVEQVGKRKDDDCNTTKVNPFIIATSFPKISSPA